jgi:hypothetical protein
MPGSSSETRGMFCGGLGSNIMVQHSYSVCAIITLRGRITYCNEYVCEQVCNQMRPMIQTLFPSNDGVSQDDSASIHTTGTVQSWFEEHEGELQYLPWLARSPYLNITEPH